MNGRAGLLGILLFALLAGCRGTPAPSAEVGRWGDTEVTARLEEIRGPFPANDLYNYAFVMKYRVLEVHRGKVSAPEIFVAHYNPLKARDRAGDQFSGRIGGSVSQFAAGDVHRLALEAPLDDHYMGGVVDRYFGEPGARYWAVWTEHAAR